MTSRPRSFTGIEARLLLRRARTGTLATLNREGGIPYASLANVATDVDGRPVILVSALAWHTRNLLADSRASLMVAEIPAMGDALTGPRISVMGRFVKLGEERLSRRYLARHPDAAIYAGFGDFALWRLEPELIHAVAGFGRIETLEASEVFPSTPEMETIEESAISHMNADHADAVQQIAAALGGEGSGRWRIAALDGDGADLVQEAQTLRLTFAEPVATAGELRRALAAAAAAARLQLTPRRPPR